MTHRRLEHVLRFQAAWLGVALLLLAAAACGDPPGGDDGMDAGDVAVDDGGVGDSDDGGGEDADLDVGAGDADADAGATLACVSTTGCNAEDGFEGTLCIERTCVSCESDEECAADGYFGDGATCGDDGRCSPCVEGAVGCPCAAGDACDEGYCVDDTCVDCDAGDTGCICDDGACEAGALCEGGVCVGCELGELGCACLEDGHCEEGLRCDVDDRCEVCPDGEESCPCGSGEDGAGELCDEGLECISGLCGPETCEAGEAGCPCTDEDTCEAGVGCHEDSMCYVCDADALGCACSAEDGCSNDLVCADGACREALTCAEAGCGEHQECQEGETGEDAVCLASCAYPYVWDTDACVLRTPTTCDDTGALSILAACIAANRTCEPGAESYDDASCGDCVDGYVEDASSGLCRPALTCEDIDATCLAAYRTCSEGTSTSDATCGACLAAFVDEAGTCAVSSDATCDEGDDAYYGWVCDALDRTCEKVEGEAPTCGDCDSGYGEHPDTGLCTVQATCEALNCELSLGRDCDSSEEPFASCGACLEGLTASDEADPGSLCREFITCLDLACGDDEFCVDSDVGGDSECVSPACDDDSAEHPTTGECVFCGNACAGQTGATGRWWPVTTSDGVCICETEPGYYLDTTSSFLPEPCDIDGDGWVRVGAEEFVNADEAVVRQNANCNVLTIDRFTLRNELLQRYEVLLCDEGLVGEDEGDACTPVESAFIDLYEPAVLDTDTEIARDTEAFPSYRYGGVGRQLRAAEVNPLTRGCTTGDYNGNGVADVIEVQGDDPPISFADEREVIFWDMAYYVELHRGWYEPRVGEAAGTWVIAERSRCDDDSAEVPFPLAYHGDESSEYWRECARNRRADYDRDDPTQGYDFARFSCSDRDDGTCADPPYLTDEVPEASIPDHGQCDGWVLPPDDGVWRGMNHHSQFRCVALIDGGTPLDYELDVADIHTGGGSSGAFAFNQCRVACPDGDDDCGDDCAGATCTTSTEAIGPEAGGGSAPVLQCEAVSAVEADDVGFVAQRYIDAEDGVTYAYEAGCIDEWEVWPDLCPGYSADPLYGTIGDGLLTDFGALRCGCTPNYGGLDCEIGCPGAMVDASYEVAPREGIWLCGGTQASHIDAGWAGYDSANPASMVGESASGTVYEVMGAVPDVPVVREQLCESVDCETGFVLY